MIKIKTQTTLKNFKGDDVKIGEDKLLTVGEVVSTVLGAQTSNPSLAWVLGKKFACEEEVELKAEDVLFIKKELTDNKHWVSMITGQVLEILE